MTGPGVSVACDALREDAVKWAAAADAVAAAKQAAEGITFAEKLGAIPRFVGGADAIIANYDRMKQKFTTALADGATVMDGVSATLKQVADTFEREDREAALRVRRARKGCDR